MTLDLATGADSPLDPVRGVSPTRSGPAQAGATAVVRPFTSVGGWFESNGSLRDEVASLEAENSALRAELNTSAYDRNRLAEYDGLTSVASDLGYSLVPVPGRRGGPGAVVLQHRDDRRRHRRRRAART